MLKIKTVLCVAAVLVAVMAEPKPQHYPNTFFPPPSSYPKPEYPERAPAYPKPSYPTPAPAYPKPTYSTTPTTPAYPKPTYPTTPAYPKPTYPTTPVYPKPTYPTPAYPKPAYPSPVPTYYPKPSYPQPAYPAPYNQKYESEFCDSRKAPKCSKNGTLTFCLEDSEYPEKEVKYAIDYDPIILKKYADVAEQSADNLVDGLTSLAEKHFDYSDYHGNTFEKGNWVGGEGYICPSDVLYARPVRAINAEGEWRVIVQEMAWPGYTQTQRTETCLFPGSSCRTLAPCYQSKCLQKYVYQRMLSFDPCYPQKGIFIDIYKLPSACSCHISA
ncbi:proline-rich protein 3-like isoform X1 [Daphnia pulex]|uniref:proline-rich protein 3-like isoform X1 n=1 Tax=Daphnia pulex TaxID=6669 RepID=UPI001EDF9514|nr:proline-rich protein 3-like isoform X1 [Daphnia pulex]